MATVASCIVHQLTATYRSDEDVSIAVVCNASRVCASSVVCARVCVCVCVCVCGISLCTATRVEPRQRLSILLAARASIGPLVNAQGLRPEPRRLWRRRRHASRAWGCANRPSSLLLSHRARWLPVACLSLTKPVGPPLAAHKPKPHPWTCLEGQHNARAGACGVGGVGLDRRWGP